MITRLSAILCIGFLAGCQDEQANLPDPIDITEESAGFYCQMALLDHVGPKGQIYLDGLSAPLFFSQVKDAIAYLHMPEQSHAVVVTYVQDMTAGTWAEPGPWMRVDEAIYVIGSDALGGMEAPEFVPFSKESAALDFVQIHGGEIRKFSAITATQALSTPPASSVNSAEDAHDISARLSALSHHKENDQ